LPRIEKHGLEPGPSRPSGFASTLASRPLGLPPRTTSLELLLGFRALELPCPKRPVESRTNRAATSYAISQTGFRLRSPIIGVAPSNRVARVSSRMFDHVVSGGWSNRTSCLRHVQEVFSRFSYRSAASSVLRSGVAPSPRRLSALGRHSFRKGSSRPSYRVADLRREPRFFSPCQHPRFCRDFDLFRRWPLGGFQLDIHTSSAKRAPSIRTPGRWHPQMNQPRPKARPARSSS
jgi:hypothetical protein